MGKKSIRYYHIIIGKEYAERWDDTSTRIEVITRNPNGFNRKGWVVIGVCGYHDKQIEN